MTTMIEHLRLPTLMLESRYELLRTMRTPAFVLPTLIFPAAFYLLFAVVMPMSKSYDMARFLLAGYGVFGVMGPALFGFGVAVATERTAGWLLLKMASPMPIVTHFLARLFMAVLFAAAVALILFALGAGFAGVRMDTTAWIALFATLTVGVIPFCALGLMIGYWVQAQAAVAIVNLIYLPMAVLSGLWWPLKLFPEAMQRIGEVLPAYHLAQIGLSAVGMDSRGRLIDHVLVLIAYTLLFLWLAARGYRRDAAARGG